VLGLTGEVTACLFDLDGVLTNTAELHRVAWKQTFDAFLRDREGPDFKPFTDDDYFDYVDGRPREDGVRTFLASRGITLPEGTPDDPPTAQTVAGVGNRKNALFRSLLAERGVTAYPGSVRYLTAVRNAGLRIGVVTSSANGAAVLRAANLDRFVDARIDGKVIEEQGLRGKPEPDSYLAGAKALGVEPSAAAVFEDALAGVQAGRAGGFALVVGIDRADRKSQGSSDEHASYAQALRQHGADLVVSDLGELADTP
jgi:beta-phosphoglucomutase family hydrolase